MLTNDGEFANILMHPNNRIEKVYVAKINGVLTGKDIAMLKNGVVIDNFGSLVLFKKLNYYSSYISRQIS